MAEGARCGNVSQSVVCKSTAGDPERIALTPAKGIWRVKAMLEARYAFVAMSQFNLFDGPGTWRR